MSIERAPDHVSWLAAIVGFVLLCIFAASMWGCDGASPTLSDSPGVIREVHP